MITDKSRYGHDAVLDLDCSDSVQVLRTEPMTLTAQEQEIVRAYLGIMLLEKSYIGANGHLILALSDGREVDLGSARGLPGATPYIGGNGNWFVEGRDTLVHAQGEPGFIPYVGENLNWWINGEDTGILARGTNGVSATHEWLGTVLRMTSASGTSEANLKGDKGDTGPQGDKGDKGDTGQQGPKGDKGDTGAQGPKGDTGAKGDVPQIGSNGNWTVGGTDTGVRAQGPKGDRGDGVPALEAANNARFLRNDGTWQTVTPANIGAADASHTQSAATITGGKFAGAVYANRDTGGQEPSYCLLRNSKIVSADTDPTVNGEISWTYK